MSDYVCTLKPSLAQHWLGLEKYANFDQAKPHKLAGSQETQHFLVVSWGVSGHTEE